MGSVFYFYTVQRLWVSFAFISLFHLTVCTDTLHPTHSPSHLFPPCFASRPNILSSHSYNTASSTSPPKQAIHPARVLTTPTHHSVFTHDEPAQDPAVLVYDLPRYIQRVAPGPPPLPPLLRLSEPRMRCTACLAGTRSKRAHHGLRIR